MKIRDHVLTLAFVGLLGALALAFLVGVLTKGMSEDADDFGKLSAAMDEDPVGNLAVRNFLSTGERMLQTMEIWINEHPGSSKYMVRLLEEAHEDLSKLNEISYLPDALQSRLEISFSQFKAESLNIGAETAKEGSEPLDPDSYKKATMAFDEALDDLESHAAGLVQKRKTRLVKERNLVDERRKKAYLYMGGGGILYLWVLGFFAWRTHRIILAPISRMAFALDESIENELRFTDTTFTETPWTNPNTIRRKGKKQTGPKEIEVLSRRLWELVHGLEETVSARTKQLVGRTFSLEEEIKARKELEIELLHAQKMKAVGQLAAGIAHEIRTPTQYVGDHLLFLEEATSKLLAAFPPKEDDQEDEFIRDNLPRAIESAMKGIERISEIVTSMKRFSYKDHEYSKQPADLNQAVRDAVAITSNEWKDCVDLETELEPELPEVECQIGEINQVLMNLIVNASQAIRDSKKGEVGKITIRTSLAEDDHVEIEVEDDGGGMPDEVSEKVFKPFFTTKDIGVGSGQGLAISHAVIEGKHHGQLTFETEMGRGTIFKIRLPIKSVGDSQQNQAPLTKESEQHES